MTFRDTIEKLDQKGALRALAIGLIVAVMIFFASNVTTEIQLAVGVIGALTLAVLKYFKKNESTRVVFLSIASFLSLDYVFWRTFSTLSEPCKALLRVLMSDPPPSYIEVGAALDMPVGSIGPRRQRCLRALRRQIEPRWAELAIDGGYYDQAHLINEFQALCGLPPSQFLARTASGSSKTPG